MSSLIRFARTKATTPRPSPRRPLGDLLQEIAEKAPDQLDDLRVIAEWILKQIHDSKQSA